MAATLSTNDGVTLWLRVKSDAADAQKQLKAVYATAKNEAVLSNRAQQQIIRDTAKTQEISDRERMKSNSLLTKLQIQNQRDYEKVLTESTRREILLRRE